MMIHMMVLYFRYLLHNFRCAFVNFKDRPSAELAAAAWASGFEIDGQTVGVKWGRSRPATKAKPVEVES
jgi:pre-mRNA-splicing factor RBM22/SLT11